MVKKRGLGKSLDALLSYTGVDLTTPATATEMVQEKLSQIPINVIQRGKYQPRQEMDPQALENLANSIRTQGIIQPLIIRPIADKNKKTAYEIIAGERRWRAAQLAGLTEVPAIVRHIPDEAAVAIALIENIQRENLNPVEEALALERLIQEFGMTHQQVAEAIGKSRTSVTNLLRLLALPEEVKILLAQGKLEMGHARALLTLPTLSQIELGSLIAAKSLSVRETESLVRRLQQPKDKKTTGELHPNISQFQEMLSQLLKLRVAIHCNAKGRGKLVIHYRNLTELDKLLAQFQE